MPIPPPIFAAVVQLVVRLAPVAYRAGKLIRRSDMTQVGGYVVSIVRRLKLGVDGAVSQMVRVSKDGKVKEIWHMVVKNGKLIHKDLKLKR